ncbi:MAG: leucyl aminopeptidase family protein [Nannocystaceae bacterium]|nr:leucyl aminopeptidase family protein [Nannocystaceae bacterium]
MRIDVVARPAEKVKGDVILATYGLPVRKDRLPFKDLLRPDASRLLVKEVDAMTWLEGHGTVAPRVIMACLGTSADGDPQDGWCGDITVSERVQRRLATSRRLGAAAEHASHAQGVRHLVLAPLPEAIDPAAFVDAILARSHANTEFQRDAEPSTLQRVTLCVDRSELARVRAEVKAAVIVAEASFVARSIADLPANIGYPGEIVRRVRELASEVGLHVDVQSPAQIKKLGMGLLAAVMRGAERPGALLTLEHRPTGYAELPTLVLLGKGVVHDTGGYNLKTTHLMHAFTDDKAGAAAVIGAMQAIARLGVPLHVVGVAPLVENVVDATAYKPGDVLSAMDGSTVFVESTDAEGRLVLADCLTWISRFSPKLVVDIATLTAASWTALGPAFAALFTNDTEARDLLVAAGMATGDLVWPMPIHPCHAAELPHRLAELRNAGPAEGGASVAAAFLRHFVDYPWAHVDMAGHGSSQVDGELQAAGGSGYGTRLLIALAQQAAQRWANERPTS